MTVSRDHNEGKSVFKLLGAVEIVCGSDGTPDLTPDDFFHDHAKTARAWLAERVDRGQSETEVASDLWEKCEAYIAAAKLYFATSKELYGDFGDHLRHEPYILTHYDSVENTATYTFIFKADNNGNTYRIRYYPVPVSRSTSKTPPAPTPDF